jgi:hypothetical protein
VLAPVPRPLRALPHLRLLEAHRMSTTNGHKSLLEALLAVQAEVPPLKKDATNPAFKSKYTPLDTVVETVGPILNRHRLVWVTLPVSNEHGQPALYYRLSHVDSQEELAGTMPLLLGKEDSQGFGSAITYARRYSLCAVLNLVADDDDDGHRASQRRPAGASSDAPTDAQMKELGRQVKMNKPTPKVLRAMLDKVGASEVTDDQLADGSWATKVNKPQVSGLLDLFKSGILPTGESDIPSDPDPVPSSVAEEAGDLPWSE